MYAAGHTCIQVCTVHDDTVADACLSALSMSAAAAAADSGLLHVCQPGNAFDKSLQLCVMCPPGEPSPF
jgi:hypothetical protein